MANIPSRIQTEDRAFVRDTHSKGLLCTDMTALERSRRQLKLADERATVAARVEKLETQMGDVADLMRQILAKLKESCNTT